MQRSVVAFPDTEDFRTGVTRLRTVVGEVGGSVLAVSAAPLDDEDETRLITSWNAARVDEYAELTAECQKLVGEIEKEFAKEKFTLAELDEEEAELEKLRSWHERILKRDVHGAEGASEAEAALNSAAQALSRFTEAVFDRTHG